MPQTATGANEEVYRKADPVACPVGERLLLVAPTDGVADLTRILCLEGTARALWEGAGNRLVASDLGRRLARDFGLSQEQANRDARTFLADLLAHGLVRAESGGSTTPPQAAGPSGTTATPSTTAATGATTIGADGFLSMARAVLGAGMCLRFRAGGYSMRPQLPTGSLLEVSPVVLIQRAVARLSSLVGPEALEVELRDHMVLGHLSTCRPPNSRPGPQCPQELDRRERNAPQREETDGRLC